MRFRPRERSGKVSVTVSPVSTLHRAVIDTRTPIMYLPGLASGARFRRSPGTFNAFALASAERQRLATGGA